MNTRRILSVLVFTFGVLFGASAQKIAIVDINDVLAALPEYEQAQATLDRFSAEWQQQVQQEFDKVKSLYNKLQAEQVLLSPEDKMKREDEIIKMEGQVRELQKQKFGPEGELFMKRQELVTPLQDKVFAAIENYAAEKAIDLIFDKSGSTGLLFTNPEYDKTGDIKRRLGIK